MRKLKWTNRAFLMCLSFISSFSFLQIFQTLSNLFPRALRVRPLLTSLFFRLIFGWSCPRVTFPSGFTQAPVPPRQVGSICYFQRRSLRQTDQWNDLSTVTKIPVSSLSSLMLGLCSHPVASILLEEIPPIMGFLVCSAGCKICLRRQWQGQLFLTNYGTGCGGWKRNCGGSHCGHRTSPHALHTMTWTETDSLLKLMNWQMDTQLLGVSILIEKTAWHGREQ